jgi:hypothetical protein
LRVETLDNPGWRIHIDLEGTPLSRRTYEGLTIKRTETDWLTCRVVGGKFEGFGGLENLQEALLEFLRWAELSRNLDSTKT